MCRGWGRGMGSYNTVDSLKITSIRIIDSKNISYIRSIKMEAEWRRQRAQRQSQPASHVPSKAVVRGL